MSWKNYFNKIKNTPFAKKAHQKDSNKYKSFPMVRNPILRFNNKNEERCYVVKGCAVTISFGRHNFQNRQIFFRHIWYISRTPCDQVIHSTLQFLVKTLKLSFWSYGTTCTCLNLFVALLYKGCVFGFVKIIFVAFHTGSLSIWLWTVIIFQFRQ